MYTHTHTYIYIYIYTYIHISTGPVSTLGILRRLCASRDWKRPPQAMLFGSLISSTDPVYIYIYIHPVVRSSTHPVSTTTRCFA